MLLESTGNLFFSGCDASLFQEQYSGKCTVARNLRGHHICLHRVLASKIDLSGAMLNWKSMHNHLIDHAASETAHPMHIDAHAIPAGQQRSRAGLDIANCIQFLARKQFSQK